MRRAADRQEYRQMRFTRPPGSTELILVRHGESEPMVPGRPFPLVDGHGDPELAPDGRIQAELVGDRLASHPIDAIYVTTLRRTVADGGAARRHARPRPDRRARPARGPPRRVGGRALPQAHGRGPSRSPSQVLSEQRWDAIPGAESAESIRTRVRGALDRIVAANAGRCVAVFSHGGDHRRDPRPGHRVGPRRSPSSARPTRRSRTSSCSATAGSCAASTTRRTCPATSTASRTSTRSRTCPA